MTAALSARIEAASCPSRELDRELTALIFDQADRHIGVYDEHDKPVIDRVWVYRDTGKLKTSATDGPEFTSDLNAAYDLAKRLAPGCTIGTCLQPKASEACVWDFSDGATEVGKSERPDQHLALAICAAAVKAAARGEADRG